MLSGIFIVSGARAVLDPDQLAARAKRVTDRIAPVLERTDPRLPTEARTLVQVNGAVQLLGALLLASGRSTRPAAAVLAGSLVPTTLAGHSFWAEDDPVARRNHQIHFLKNVGLFGGLLLAAADTRGRPGLRWRARHLVDSTRRSGRRTVRAAQRDLRLARRAVEVGRRLPG
jgi:putative oxidoreductase